MQSLEEVAVLLRLGHHIQGAGGWVNNRSAGNSDFGSDVFIRLGEVVIGDGGDSCAGIYEAALPQSTRRGTVCIEGVDAVMLGGSVDHIVGSLSRNRYSWH